MSNAVVGMCLFLAEVIERAGGDHGIDLSRIRISVSREEYDGLCEYMRGLMMQNAGVPDRSANVIAPDATITVPGWDTVVVPEAQVRAPTPAVVTVCGIKVVVDDAR